jgi:hypothetical protein
MGTRTPANGFGGRRSPWQVVLQYVLLAATIAAVVLLFLTLQNAFTVVLAVAFSGADAFETAYRQSLLSKGIAIALGIAAMAAVITGEWYYGRARGFRDLLRRFAGVVGTIGLLLFASHAVIWLFAGRSLLSLLLAGGELLLGGALLVLSKRTKKQ